MLKYLGYASEYKKPANRWMSYRISSKKDLSIDGQDFDDISAFHAFCARNRFYLRCSYDKGFGFEILEDVIDEKD